MWVATVIGETFHLTEVDLDKEILYIDSNNLYSGGINLADDAIYLGDGNPSKELGEPLSFTRTPEIFMAVLAQAMKVGEKALCHPLDGPEYYLVKGGQG